MIIVPMLMGRGGGDPIHRCQHCGEPIYRSDKWLDRILFDGGFLRSMVMMLCFLVIAAMGLLALMDITYNWMNGQPLHEAILAQWRFVAGLKW